MRRNEAEKLIGKLVHNEEYIGELINITDDKPFRANIKVRAVLVYPSLFDHNMSMRFMEKPRFPKGEGAIIQCGAKYLFAHTGQLVTYEHSLILAIEKYERKAQEYIESCQAAEKNLYHCYWGHDVKNAEKLLCILQEHRRILGLRSEGDE